MENRLKPVLQSGRLPGRGEDANKAWVSSLVEDGDFCLRLPNAENAVIDPEKVRDYLLSPSHAVGRFKAAFFSSLGYAQENWRQFEADLRRQHLPKDAVLGRDTSYGRKYEIHGRIKGPAGRTSQVVSVWIILADEETPRFVTAYPGGNR